MPAARTVGARILATDPKGITAVEGVPPYFFYWLDVVFVLRFELIATIVP